MRVEIEGPSSLNSQRFSQESADEMLLASTEKKQRTDVKLSALSPEEQKAFQDAKQTEIKNWLSTGREKLAPEQILRCRWLLVWKNREENQNGTKEENRAKSKLETNKPKARLVVLGYLDLNLNLTEVPRDSPTLGRMSKMLMLQLISSMGWSLGSFDIKTVFLQGRPHESRVTRTRACKSNAT